MNPGLKGRNLRTAFDTSEYQVMIAANRFQTGFDQPRLCAMYVDEKLGGVDCVQPLSRLNRKHPGKEETYVVDFFNDLWIEVTRFSEIFFVKSQSAAAISNVCRPAVDRWQKRYAKAREEYEQHKKLFEHAKSVGDATFIANIEAQMKESKVALDALGLFKADLTTFTRYYEFMSKIVDFDSQDLEILSLYARHLAPLLREKTPDEDPIDLSSVRLIHYRLSKIKQQDLKLTKEGAEGLVPTSELGTGKPRNKEEAWLSEIITRLNQLFITDGLTDNDLINYAYAIRAKISENETVMHQLANNSAEQALLGDFPTALDDAVMESSEAHQSQMMQYLNSKELQAGFQRVVFDMLLAKGSQGLGSRKSRG